MTDAHATHGEWRRGWPVVAAAMLGIGFGPGLFQNLSSLFVPGVIAQLGWSRGDIATAAGVGLLGGLAVPFIGRLADKLGARVLIVATMLMLAAAYLAMSAIDGPLWQYRVLVFLLALAVPGTSSVVYGKLIAARFVHARGIALAVATSGISVTTLGLAPVLGWIIAAYGWRRGLIALAATVGAVALPAILLALRGVAAGPTRAAPDAPEAVVPIEGLTGREARRDARYWRLGLGAALINVGSVGLVTQLVPFGLDHGLRPAQAALLLTSFATSQVVGRVAMGLGLDRFRPQWIAGGFAATSALAFAALQWEAGFAGLMVLVFLAGLMNGAENDLLPFLTARLFGLRSYGENYGLLVTLALIGTGVGITGFGRSFDATGDYGLALAVSAGALGLAALLFVTLDDRDLPRVQAAAHAA